MDKLLTENIAHNYPIDL